MLAALTLLCFLPSGAGRLAADRTWPAWQRERVELDRCLVKDEFRVFYTLHGKNALPREAQADADGDGAPDRIQNIALQLTVAREVYTKVMGLRHPFASPRYKGRVRFFDVHVWDIDGYGSAGDGIVNYHRLADPPEGVPVLTIDLDYKNSTRNLSPAHELFHEFQNGYTLFKNAWYTEGTARWAEYALRKGAGKPEPLPKTAAAVAALFTRRYDASRFWEALCRAVDPRGALDIPESLRSIKYVGTNEPVIEDDRLYGASFLKALLEELDRVDDRASAQAGLDPLDWPEERQRSHDNDPFLWEAVLTVCREYADASPALREMLAAVGKTP